MTRKTEHVLVYASASWFTKHQTAVMKSMQFSGKLLRISFIFYLWNMLFVILYGIQAPFPDV